MSSLPPYNPDRSERSLWLLNVATSPPQRRRLMASVGPSEVVEASDATGLEERVRAANREITVVAREATLEALVLALVGGHEGMARLRFAPGALSQVQMLPDRAVVRHLNLGRAV
jgi:hypothetical protein